MPRLRAAAVFPTKTPKINFLLSGACLVIVACQIALLATIPKVCPGCIAVGCATVMALVVRHTPPRDFAKANYLKLVLLPVVLVCGLTLVGSRFGRPMAPVRQQEVNLVGKEVVTLGVPTFAHKSTVIVLTLPGCKWCDQTKEKLKFMNIRFSSVSMADIALDSPIDRGFAPQILEFKQGIVTQHIRGYSEDALTQLK